MNRPPLFPSDSDDPQDRQAWLAQRDALRRLHLDVFEEPTPPALLATAGQASRRRALQTRWTRWGGIAAGVLLAFGAGWMANMQWTQRQPGALMARGPAAREFVHAASVAHAVYAPEKRHPVEVVAAEQQHLVQWLSRRLDKPLKVPDLSTAGYMLVGGRLLPGDTGARAQFMFEDTAGQRVTLYIGTLDGATPGAKPGPPSTPASRPPDETSFRFSSDGPVPSFYWADRGLGYAIAGALDRPTLMNLATLAYRQLY